MFGLLAELLGLWRDGRPRPSSRAKLGIPQAHGP